MNQKVLQIRNVFSIFVGSVLLMSLYAEVSADEPLRVMSFNIRYGTARDGDNVWKNRKQLVPATVKQFGPDLLGTQETLKFQAEYLKEHLKDYTAYGRSREKDENKGEQCTLFYRTSRFEFVSKGQFWLSESPEKIASKSWDSSLPRIATWIRLKDRKNDNAELLFLNTHFDHRGSKARLESARLIARKLAEFKLPSVVTGDFNCGVDSAPYKALMESKQIDLVDTFRVAHPKQSKKTGTFNGFRGVDSGARIDWVLHSKSFRTDEAKIEKYNESGRYPSDHFPVSAVLQWK